MREQITKVLADIIRDKLSSNGAINIQGLGKFTIKHQPFSETTHPNGSVKMNPPSNQIEFEEEFK